MPELKTAEVQKMDLAKLDTEMKSRMDEVQRITDGVEDWSQIPADREGADRLPAMMKELNMLGERRDEIHGARESQKAYTALKEVLTNPDIVLEKPKAARPQRLDFVGHISKGVNGQPSLLEKVRDGARNIATELPLEAFGLKATVGEDATQTNVDTDYPVRTDRLPGLVDELFQVPTIASLIPSVTTTSDSIEYVTEDYTDAAAETNEGDDAPGATLDFGLVTETVRKIAVQAQATEEVLSDVGLMRGLVGLRLTQDLARREDNSVLAGDGVAPNLEGILTRAGTGNVNYSVGGGTAQDLIEAVFNAAVSVQQAFLSPTVATMAIATWAQMRLAKDGQNQYLLGPANGDVAPRVWGYRVLPTEIMPAVGLGNKFILIGDWASSALIARNGTVRTAVTDAHASNFTKDILTFKATMREALIVHRPAGFATVTGIA